MQELYHSLWVLARNELLGSVSGIKRHGANFSDYVARPAS